MNKKITKRLLSGAIALALTCTGVVASAATASAATISYETDIYPTTFTDLYNDSINHKKVQIGEYDCWIKDGQYYTVEDGEICQVINLDELVWRTNTSRASLNWLNGPVVDISDGNEYKGTVDITTTDYNTPIFIGYTPDTVKDRISYNIKVNFTLPNKYRVGVHQYNSVYESWDYSEFDITFSLFGHNRILFSGLTGVAPTKMCLIFIEGQSTGKDNFDYSFFVV